MLRIEFAKTQEARGPTNYANVEYHGARVLLSLVEPWAGTGRHICADSYFASVGTAVALYRNGRRLTGVVKTSSKKFPLT